MALVAPQAKHCVRPVHSTPASPGSAGREHFQFLLPTFPAATAHKTLVANVLSALCVHRVKQTSWKSPFSIILCVIFLFYSPACDFSTRGRGRTSVSLSYLLLVSITVHTRIPVELLHIQVILPSTLPSAAGLSQSCGCWRNTVIIQIQTVAVTVTWSLFFLFVSI